MLDGDLERYTETASVELRYSNVIVDPTRRQCMRKYTGWLGRLGDASSFRSLEENFQSKNTGKNHATGIAHQKFNQSPKIP